MSNTSSSNSSVCFDERFHKLRPLSMSLQWTLEPFGVSITNRICHKYKQ